MTHGFFLQIDTICIYAQKKLNLMRLLLKFCSTSVREVGAYYIVKF